MGNLSNETMNNKINSANSEFKNRLDGAEKGLEKMARDVGQNVGAMAMDLEQTATKYLKTGRDYVQENPAKSVAIAAAAGLVAGGLLTLAMTRRNS